MAHDHKTSSAIAEVSPTVGDLRTAADRLQLALESGELDAVQDALDGIVDLGNAAALTLSR